MARLMQLTDGTTTVNLLTGDLKLTADSWSTTTSNELVWETFDLASESADATIRTVKKQIDSLAQAAEDYHANQQKADGIYFRWNADGESAKQALVYEIQSEILADEVLSGALLGKNAVILRVAILRHQNYESVSGDVTDSAANVSCKGGTWDIGATIGSAQMGTVDGRIKSLIFSGTDPSPNVIQQVWAGIRPYYQGTYAFDPFWEAEDGSGAADSIGTASGGAAVTCDLTSTANEGHRTSITLGDITASNYDDFIGRYLVLARMRVRSALTEVNVEMRQYWNGSFSHLGSTYIPGTTAWTLYPMGVVAFPPTGNRDNTASGHADFSKCGFSIFAKSADDTGTLDIDCYILIPAEYMVAVEGCQIDQPTSSTLTIYTDPDDQQWALGTSSLAQGGLRPSPENWRYPIGGGVLVLAGQADSAHVLANTMDLEIVATPRWRSYR